MVLYLLSNELFVIESYSEYMTISSLILWPKQKKGRDGAPGHSASIPV